MPPKKTSAVILLLVLAGFVFLAAAKQYDFWPSQAAMTDTISSTTAAAGAPAMADRAQQQGLAGSAMAAGNRLHGPQPTLPSKAQPTQNAAPTAKTEPVVVLTPGATQATILTPVPTSKPDATQKPTSKPSPATPTAKPTATQTPTPTAKPTATQTPTPTAKPTATQAPTPTTKPTVTMAPTPTVTPVPTVTPAPTVTPTPAPTGGTHPQEAYWISEIFRLTNLERQAEGLPVFQQPSQALLQAAALRAEECSHKDHFSHTRPDGSPWHTVLQDVSYRTAGENLWRGTAGYFTPADVVAGWMNSEGHRKNILNPDFCTLGVGVYRSYESGKPRYDVAVQLFIGNGN